MRVAIGLLWMFITLISPVQAETLKVIGIPGAPYRFYNDANEVVGFDIDILDEIMTKIGLDYEVQLYTSSTRLIQEWQNPEVDMVFTLSKKPQRLDTLIFPEEPHLNLSWNFFIRKDSVGKINFQSYEDLHGLKVGATEGFAYTPEFWQAAESGAFELDLVVNHHLNLKKLIHGRFDLFPSNTLSTLHQAKLTGVEKEITFLKKPLKQTPYFNVFVKASDFQGLPDVIKKYNQELKAMKQDGRYDVIYQRYF